MYSPIDNPVAIAIVATLQAVYLLGKYPSLPISSPSGLLNRLAHVALLLAMGWLVYSIPWVLLAFSMGGSIASLPHGLYFVLGSFALIGAVYTRNPMVGGFVGGSVPLATLSLFYLSTNKEWQAIAPPLAWFGMFMVFGGLLGALSAPTAISFFQTALLQVPNLHGKRHEKEGLGGQFSGLYDVFFSHNSKDKPTVRILARALESRGLRVWLDEDQLAPGRSWQKEIEKIIRTTRSSIVLVGKDGLGPWEIPEMNACLSQFVKREMPVIPVLLPDAPAEPELPIFLQTLTWVDLRGGITPENLDRLKWGITGIKP